MTAERARAADTFEPYGLGWRWVGVSRTVRITVRRLRREGGKLYGYVDVEYKAPGTARDAPADRLAGEWVALSTGRDRVSFANRLAERHKDIDWRNLIEAFCVAVEQREDQKEPIVWVGNLPRPLDGGWLIDGLLERNQNNSIHGDGGSGKSFVALAACISVTTGLEVLPGFRPLVTGPALYCDNETDQATLNYRTQQVARGMGVPAPDIAYLRMDEAFADETERVAALVQQHGFVLIVVDSVEAAMAGSTGDRAANIEGPARLNRALRRIGPITTLLVDHVSAEQAQQEGVVRKAYGSIFKRNWVRRAWHLKAARESVDADRHLGLFVAKSNNGNEQAPPVGLRWVINDAECRWAREPIEEPELEKALPPTDRIVAHLRRRGPQTPAEIAEATELKGGTVRPILSRRDTLFRRRVDGLWTLAEDADGADDEELP